jgi:DNA-binding MarR family transcriptional regulator
MKLEEALKTDKFVNERQKATLNVLYSAYWLRNTISKALKQEDITMEQFNVMRILNGSHPTQLCVKDICSRMIEASSNVPRIVDKLVDKKLAKRTASKEDKRETLVALTDKGIELVERARLQVDQVTIELMGLNETEAKTLNTLLDKLRSE